jgi:hypothetical protein
MLLILFLAKELAKAKKELDDAEAKRFVELQKRKKQEEEAEKRRMLEILARDKEERFGKKFDITQTEKKTVTPLDDVKYFTDAIIKLYPIFRCGTQAKDCLNIVKVAISNILKSPEEEKFRKIKMTNPTVQEKLAKIPLGIKLLKSLGFVEQEEFYVLEKFEKELLENSVNLMNNAISKLT